MMDLFESERLKVVFNVQSTKANDSFSNSNNIFRKFCFSEWKEKNLYAVNITESSNWDVRYFSEIWTEFNPFYKSKNEKVGI